MSRAAAETGGVRPSPNIWEAPDDYEVENEAFDSEGVVEAALGSLTEFAGRRVLDIGCGTGFHLPRYAALGAEVVGVEPHPPLLLRARARVAALASERAERIAVLGGEADHLPLASSSVDVVLARWAYFFGPGSEPGLAQVQRVLRPGGLAAFLDNDASRSTFGAWFRSSLPGYDPVAVGRFWRRHGFSSLALDAAWRCRTRADFERIVRIEFAPALAESILAAHPGTEVDYAVTLWWRRF